MLFRDLKIRTKYPLVIVALALLAAFATGFVAYTHSDREMRAAAELKLLALLESRKAALDSYFTSIREDLRFQSESRLVIDAIGAFSWNWKALGEGQTETLQRLYITDNPFPTGEREFMDSADDESAYSAAHQQYHPAFRKFRRERGYTDIFLFDPDGNLIYTVVKGRDYATNLVTGEWKTTDLGKAFRAARDNPKPGFQAFFDFRFYQPSFEVPASFISTPVFNAVGTFIGVLAFEMPIGRLNKVMQVTAGMGETGETFVVGRDLLMRSESRFSFESTILKTRVDTVTARKALNGETGVEVTPDYRGVPVLSAYAPQDFLGTRWAIMAEVDEAEVLAPVYKMRDFMLIVGAIITVVIAAIGYFLATALSRPIVVMTDAMARLARRELEIEIPSLNRGDEIGEMASALKVFQENAVERKRAEEALEAKEAQLRFAFDNMRGGIFMVDKDLNLQVFSESFAEYYKFPNRLLRKGASLIPLIEFRAKRGDYGPGDPAELVRTRIEGYRSFEERRVEDRLPGGRIVELFRTVTEDGGVVVVFNDITDRKQAEEELKAQTELVDMLRTTAADANKATNFDDAMHTCLAAVNDYTGWPVGHVYFLSDEDDDVLVPSGIWHLENPKRFAVFVEATKKTTFERGVGLPGRVLESGEPAWIVDVSKDSNFPRAKLAEDIGVHGAFAFPVLSGDKVVAVLEFFDEKVDEPDETLLAAVVHIGGQLGRVFERKRAETKLRNAMDEIDEANRSLERKVKARTRELHEAKDEAEAARQEAETANLTKSEFLANMSHELRTPLNAIIGFSGMIKGAMFGPLESKYQDYASDINASGEHLLGIIADILDISKVEAGALDIEEEEVDLAETAVACEMMVSGRVEEAGVTLTFDVAAELPSLHADPLRLKQILLNLIANAIKFTPQGGRITVTGETNGNGGVALVVRDTGVGITKEDIPKVLEKFGQIRDGHMHAHEGTGLGLALAKSLMERHGGTLVIESEVGKGTTVTVTFPPERTKKPPGRRTA